MKKLGPWALAVIIVIAGITLTHWVREIQESKLSQERAEKIRDVLLDAIAQEFKEISVTHRRPISPSVGISVIAHANQDLQALLKLIE